MEGHTSSLCVLAGITRLPASIPGREVVRRFLTVTTFSAPPWLKTRTGYYTFSCSSNYKEDCQLWKLVRILHAIRF